MPLLRFCYARHFPPTLMQEIQLELLRMRRQTKSVMGICLEWVPATNAPAKYETLLEIKGKLHNSDPQQTLSSPVVQSPLIGIGFCRCRSK